MDLHVCALVEAFRPHASGTPRTAAPIAITSSFEGSAASVEPWSIPSSIHELKLRAPPQPLTIASASGANTLLSCVTRCTVDALAKEQPFGIATYD